MAGTAPEHAVDARGVHFHYFESPNGVKEVTLAAKPGERILVLGRNGSGKSTLLSLLGGRRAPQQGTVTVLGRDAFDDTSLNSVVSLIGVPWPPEAYFGNTVDNIATPVPLPQRRLDIARGLHLPLKAWVDKMSAGEKRRVQILHGMLNEHKLLLLDECSTEVDVAERATVLQLAQKECETLGTVCVYATHILDGVEDWATRVVLVEDGRIVRDEPYNAALEADKHLAHQWLSRQPFVPFPDPALYRFNPADVSDAANAVVCDGLTWKHIFKNLKFCVPRGSRTLLVGCNGSGKSTLLHLLAGRQFFPNEGNALRILGKPCYHDMSLNYQVAFGGDWWPKAPSGQMTVAQLVPQPMTEHAAKVCSLLKVELGWDVRHVSAGEQKRVQLLLALQEPREVVLLDEATADLDLDMRHVLLHYLLAECEQRGVTVVYTTHIFEGLDNWATDCIILDRTACGVHKHLRGADVQLRSVVQTLHELKAAEHFEP